MEERKELSFGKDGICYSGSRKDNFPFRPIAAVVQFGSSYLNWN